MISASYNVSSITDNGTGDYTVNFTTAFSTAHYGIVIGIRNDSDASPVASLEIRVSGATAPTAAACRIRAYENSAVSNNISEWYMSFFGDQ